eukprot:6481693-Amphidinium_carterae.1
MGFKWFLSWGRSGLHKASFFCGAFRSLSEPLHVSDDIYYFVTCIGYLSISIFACLTFARRPLCINRRMSCTASCQCEQDTAALAADELAIAAFTAVDSDLVVSRGLERKCGPQHSNVVSSATISNTFAASLLIC